MAHLFKNVFSKVSCFTSRTFMTSPIRQIKEEIIPTKNQKRILVWTKFYPNVESVPDRVMVGKMRKSMDIFRIRVSIGMMIATLMGAVGMIFYGRHLRASGDSAKKRGEAQVKEWREMKRAELEREEEQKKNGK